MDCWQTLGIEETDDKRAIKRAYAKQLKLNNPEDDPEAFQNLRESYDHALQIAEYARYEQEDLDEEPKFDNNYSSSSINEQAQPEHTLAVEVELSEKDKIRHQQTETINKDLDELIPVLQQDEQKAIEHCKTLLNDDYYQALDVRYEFEGRLILALLKNSLYSFNFALFLAEIFDWDINLNRPGNLFNNHFENDTRFSGAFYRFVQPFLIDLIRRDFNKTLNNWHPGVEPETIATLDSLLFFETNIEGLEKFFNKRKHKTLAQSAFKHLTSNSFVTPYTSVVPHTTTKWLLDNKIIKDDPSKFSQAESAETSSKKSSVPFWVIWLILFVIIRGVFAIMNDNDAPSSPISKEELTELTNSLDSTTRDSFQVHNRREQAENGNAQSQFWLGYNYLRGTNGLEKNDNVAMFWIKKAADQEYAAAEEVLGILYMSGEAGERNDDFAIDYLSKAAAKDRPDANYWLAQYFYEGRAVEKDLTYADDLLQKSASLGSPRGLQQLGSKLIYDGNGQDDIDKGFDYLRQAADLEDISAIRQLAMELLYGTYIERNYSEAADLLISIKDRNWPLANFWLSQLYLKGKGLRSDYSQYQSLLNQSKETANPQDINSFAWDLVTTTNIELRNGPLAIDLMKEVLDDSSNITSARVDTLAAAYAEVGDFENAIIQQERAITLLPVNSSLEVTSNFESRLRKYRNGLKVTD